MFITGHFTATLDGVSLGETEQGWEMVEAHLTEDIVTDSGGDAPVDGVQRGTRCEVRGTYVEYDKVVDALYYANDSGSSRGNVGKLLTNLAGILVLTPVPGTTAAADLGEGNSLIFHRAIVVSDITTLLSTRHRKGPITFRCYPSVMASGLIYSIGTATTAS
jgi:hypothetical protein